MLEDEAKGGAGWGGGWRNSGWRVDAHY